MTTSYDIKWQSGGNEGIPGKEDIILPQKTNNSTSTSLTLTGRGVANYGEIQQENFIRLMENFASASPPPHPTIGQLWYNAAESILYLRVDPDTVGELQPRYFPQSPAAWVQIWPSRTTFASLTEYAPMAAMINKIIGTPSTEGSSTNCETIQYGWGQTDLVPEYDSVNKLKAGFDPNIYPQQFDNTAWVILLSRLRKAMRHVGLDESTVSPVGFIDDGRPTPPNGSHLANNYNDNPAQTSLPDYTAGWGGVGYLTLQLYYAATLNAISDLKNNRLARPPQSTETHVLVTATRTTAWDSTISHTVRLTFQDENAAKAYFNTGGSLQFNMDLASPGSDLISTNWSQWLALISGLHFDLKGIKLNDGNYYVTSSGQIVGFCDLTSTMMTIFSRRRDIAHTGSGYNSSVYSVYDNIIDSGLQIDARRYNSSGHHVLEFVVRFIEDNSQNIYGSGFITGNLTSTITGYKASANNINSPVIAFPTTVGSDTTIQ
jgi:hypothetical protein